MNVSFATGNIMTPLNMVELLNLVLDMLAFLPINFFACSNTMARLAGQVCKLFTE